MSNQNDINLQTIENVMTEVRRNWSVMLQSDVLESYLPLSLLISHD